MYIVRNSAGKIEIVCTRLEDAMCIVSSGKVDNEEYTLEDTRAKEDEYIINMAEMYNDGIGEGQVR